MYMCNSRKSKPKELNGSANEQFGAHSDTSMFLKWKFDMIVHMH